MDMLPRHNHNSFCSETRMSLSQLYECQLLPNCPEKSCCGSPMAAYPSTSLHHGRFATIAITSYENRLFIIKLLILIKLKKYPQTCQCPNLSKLCLNLSKLCQNAFTLKALARVLTK